MKAQRSRQCFLAWTKEKEICIFVLCSSFQVEYGDLAAMPLDLCSISCRWVNLGENVVKANAMTA
jgi:hypothetical protein